MTQMLNYQTENKNSMINKPGALMEEGTNEEKLPLPEQKNI